MEDDSKGKSIGVSESKSYLDKPPLEVRVLVMEHRDKYLSTVETMLVSFGYIVSKCQQAKDALSLLVENKSSYDIVISDTHLPDMDGFKLLEKVGSEMDLPVVLILSERQRDSILEGIFHGDRGYFIKPITYESLGQIKEQILVKKENRELAIRVLLVGDDDQLQDQTANNNVLLSDHDQDQYSPAINEANHANNKSANLKRVKDEENHDQELHDDRALSFDATKTKKPRLVWSPELHRKFITAVEQLGSKNAVPKKILESMQNMGVSSLTRENVASHLQKYRINVEKTTNQSQTKSLLGLPKIRVGQNYALDGRYKLIQSSAGPDQLHFPRLTLGPNFDHVTVLPNQIRHINSCMDSSFDHVAIPPDQIRHIDSHLDSSFDHVTVPPNQIKHINSCLDSSFEYVAVPPDQIRHINSRLDSSSVQAMGPDHHKMTQQFVDHNIDGRIPSNNSTIPVRQARNLQRNETPDQFFWKTNNDQYYQQNETAPSRQIMDEAEIHFQPFGYNVCENVIANATNSMNINNGAMPQHLATSRQHDDFPPLNMTNSGHPTINSSTSYGNNSFIDNQIVDHVAGEEYVNLGNNDIGPYYNEPVDENAYYHHILVQPEQRFDGDIFMQKPFTPQSGSGLAKTK